jgi:hypothetical protein
MSDRLITCGFGRKAYNDEEGGTSNGFADMPYHFSSLSLAHPYKSNNDHVIKSSKDSPVLHYVSVPHITRSS